MQVTPDVSVVIPTRNMGHLIERQLRAVLGQVTASTLEIIVVDNESSDDTVAVVESLARSHPSVKLLRASPAGPNVARNTGIRAACASVIALCDADDIVRPDWISELLGSLSGEQFAGGAIVRGGANCESVRLRWDLVHSVPVVPEFPFRGVPTPMSANCAFRKSVWESIGGFDEGLLVGGDEAEFFWRATMAGFDFLRVPSAVVDYFLPADLAATWRRGRTYGRNHFLLGLRHGEIKSVSTLAKQWLLALIAIPRTVAVRRGRYQSVHVLGKLTGETQSRLKRMRKRGRTEQPRVVGLAPLCCGERIQSNDLVGPSNRG